MTIYWENVLAFLVGLVVFLIAVVIIMVILYLGARLVFHAWHKTKQYFKE